MVTNVEGGMTARTQIPYTFIKAKLTQKWAKNGHFRPKNALIDLKIGHILYLGGFYEFSNFQRKSSKIARFFAKKTNFSKKNTEKKFRRTKKHKKQRLDSFRTP